MLGALHFPSNGKRRRSAGIFSARLIITVAILGFVGGVLFASSSFHTRSAALMDGADQDRVYYAFCADARAAGVAPLYRGDPGYRPQLDADSDGVACEPMPRR